MTLSLFLDIVVFIALLFCIIFMLVSMRQILNHIRSEKRMLANFLGPLILFLPSFFDERGNVFRIRFLVFAAIAGILGLFKALRG
jgi:hypothetical protein